jgi:succinoglycan biosynthesis transport protein ExoP
MTFSEFLRVLRARWILAASIFLTLVTLTLVASLLWPKKYTAEAAVMIDMKVDPVAGTSAAGLMPSAAYLATQVDIIKSNFVAQKVVKSMQLDGNPAMRAEWESGTKKGDYDAWLSAKILNNLKVESARESNVIEISYDAVDPKFAAALANGFAKAYIDSTVQFKTTPAKQYSDFFEERANLARQKLEAAQTRLADAQKEKGILVTDEKLDAETTKLNDLSAQLTALRGLVADTSSRRTQASSNGDVSPDAMANSVVSGLRSELTRLESRLDESLERYGDSHPQILELRANIASTRSKLRAEIARVGNSLGASSQISQSREASIRTAVNEQREVLLKLKQSRNELAVLEREVGAAQRVFDAIQARQSQMNLEGSNGQTNIVVLNTATEPPAPSSPKILINTILGAIVGAIAASLITLGVELSNRKVRGVSDLISLLHTPVIGYLPSPSKSGPRWFGQDQNLLYSNDNLGLIDHHGSGHNPTFGSLR